MHAPMPDPAHTCPLARVIGLLLHDYFDYDYDYDYRDDDCNFVDTHPRLPPSTPTSDPHPRTPPPNPTLDLHSRGGARLL